MTCAKTVVRCVLVLRDGRIFHGQNWCENPQDHCPRLPGEGYAKCGEICRQVGHAEIVAMEKARAAGGDLTDATAIVKGHYRVCKECAQALRDAGVSRIIVQVKDDNGRHDSYSQ